MLFNEAELEKISKNFWSKVDNLMKDLDPTRIMTKKDGTYIYTILVPGFSKEEITVKNHKETKGLLITGNKTDANTGETRTLSHSYTYPKGLTLKSVKCENGLLYVIFEDITKASTGEEVKID